ncbi:MAG TPA: ABC transporter ATP-binding protein [Verrucomicrobiae bacterium]|nr:ABC transporter ATP-binding protein [Verrucomicrobiae bacterium]
MNDIAIQAEGLSKLYRIGALQRCNTLRDQIVHGIKGVFQRKAQSDSIWALKDVSFNVKRGEAIGLIGRNGAGKSTLLKILSRITEPTSGQVKIRGRVGSLLEVGTGFHSELTGRENIYMSGALLGMTKRETDRKFDDIVSFAEVGKFIDTPVKRYSSGMYTRLAFAVAAHLDTEILLVDEVLAVGDAAFQKKCLGQMEKAAHKQGRTVVFVSHNMAAIENLCTSALLLDDGRIVRRGATPQVIGHYLETVLPALVQGMPLSERVDRTGTGTVQFSSFHVEDAQGNRLAAVRSGMDVVFVFGYQCRDGEKPKDVDVGFSLTSGKGQMLCVLYSSYLGQYFNGLSGSGFVRCRVPKFPFPPGRYSVGARVVVAGEESDWPRNWVAFLDVEGGDFYGSGSGGFGSATPYLLSGEWSADGSWK